MRRLCPEHRWWECRHPELARPLIGKIMIAVGIGNIALAIYMLVGR